MHVGNYLTLLHRSEAELAESFRTVAEHHRAEPDIATICHRFARECATHGERLAPLLAHYAARAPEPPDDLKTVLFHGARSGGLGLLRDLHDLWLLTHDVQLCWTILRQAGQALRDEQLLTACQDLGGQTDGQIAWLQTRIKAVAPQALVVAS